MKNVLCTPSISILKYIHNKKINIVYDANIILKSHEIL